jgi:hypothetical protein
MLLSQVNICLITNWKEGRKAQVPALVLKGPSAGVYPALTRPLPGYGRMNTGYRAVELRLN